MDVNLKILFPQSQQVSLCHLLEEFVSLSAIVDFSEGLLILECGETEPVKALDVSKVGGPRMVTLPGIEPEMSITVSPGASFVFRVDKYMYYIWKINAKEELDAYEVFFSERCETKDSCCFSNDSKVAVVVVAVVVVAVVVVVVAVRRCNQFFEKNNSRIFDLVTGDHKSVRFDFDQKFHSGTKLFCLNKDRVLIAAQQRSLEFLDMDSGELLGSSLQRYLTRDSLKLLKLSPKETMMAFPKINGDMEFLRLRIPQDALLSSMKREAAGN